MLTQDPTHPFEHASPGFPGHEAGPESPTVTTTTVVNTKKVQRSGLTFGPNVRASVNEVFTPPFNPPHIASHGLSRLEKGPIPPGMSHQTGVNLHNFGSPIRYLPLAPPIPPVSRTSTTFFENRHIIPNQLAVGGAYNGETIMHKQSIADIWDTNGNLQGPRTKLASQKTVGQICENTCGCCKKFNRLCRPCCPSAGCPWWLELLTALLIVGTLYAVYMIMKRVFSAPNCPCLTNVGATNFAPNITSSASTVSTPSEQNPSKKVILTCNDGYFLYNEKCISCPNQSTWNGTHCTKVKYVNRTTTTITNSSGTFTVNADNQTTEVKSHLNQKNVHSKHK